MTFAIIGLGYISQRHLSAIYDLGHKVLYACDICTNVGFLDKYDKDIDFMTDEIEFFRKTAEVDYTVICTPNYLHLSHILRVLSQKVICEKPVVYRQEDLAILLKLTSKEIYCVKQLRLHDDIKGLLGKLNKDTFYYVDVNYHTPRGAWYRKTWKVEADKSGGIIFNIGIHLFDLLVRLFGEPVSHATEYIHQEDARGSVDFKNATVNWKLSILNHTDKVTRDFNINGINYDLSNNDLHKREYEAILSGQGLKVKDVKTTIELVCGLQS